MKIVDVVLPDSHEIILEGDEHRGSLLFNKEELTKCHNYILEDPNRFVIKMGDLIEAIMMDDKRMDVGTTGEFIMSQIKNSLVEMMPIKNKILVILDGNHELHADRRLGENITQHWCTELNKAGGKMHYGTYSSVVRVLSNDLKVMYKIFVTHGRKAISTSADDPQRQASNMRLVLKRHLKEKMGDCLIMAKGHAHKLLLAKPLRTRVMTSTKTGNTYGIKTRYMFTENKEGYIHHDHRYYICTGSFMKLYGNGFSGYAEQAEYDPVDLGYAIIKVTDRQVEDVTLKIIE